MLPTCLPPTSSSSTLLPLKHPRNKPVWHSVRVAFPVLPVLAAAAVLIPHTAVDQQYGHVHDVEVREEVSEATGGTVRQGAHQVASVVEVPGNAPETRGHKLAVVEATVSRAVRTLDVRWFTAPDGAGALGASEQILLVVGGAEDVVTDEPE